MVSRLDWMLRKYDGQRLVSSEHMYFNAAVYSGVCELEFSSVHLL